MVGLGETNDEILEVMRDLRAHDVDMLTVGQYLQPSKHHLPVTRFVHPDDFADVRGAKPRSVGFTNAACGPMVRSSYHADRQAQDAGAVWRAASGVARGIRTWNPSPASAASASASGTSGS